MKDTGRLALWTRMQRASLHMLLAITENKNQFVTLLWYHTENAYDSFQNIPFYPNYLSEIMVILYISNINNFGFVRSIMPDLVTKMILKLLFHKAYFPFALVKYGSNNVRKQLHTK